MKSGQVSQHDVWVCVSDNTVGLNRVCLVPRLSGVGGMVTFQQKLSNGLLRRGVEVCYQLRDHPYQAVLVIGGTRDLVGLQRARRSGIPIIQRLDGMNWLHRHFGLARMGWRQYMRAEYGNWLLALIRRLFSDRIVYQSEFSLKWWERAHGKLSAPYRVIHNGVDLNIFNPQGEGVIPADRWRILMVEGSLMGGYEHGLSAALDVVIALSERLRSEGQTNARNFVELAIAGRVDDTIKKRWDESLRCGMHQDKVRINWLGLLEHHNIPTIDRSAQLLYSSDINPACPNSVIEALACGLPVCAFDTGALSELVRDGAGAVVPYGGNPWKLDLPDSRSLADSMMEILFDQDQYRRAARSRAEAAFGLEPMIDSYLEMLGV